ncbi:MAG: Uma2 family endonuclease [Phycisphaeraceae bacterium]|nr:Uma2 family endonuclease [Phycisphaeraceae bacterium]
MVRSVDHPRPAEPQYIGIRCSADEYLALEHDGFRYQLINGVVIMSPRPTPHHQSILLAILRQIDPAALSLGGAVLPEVDLRLAPDLVYSPDVCYVAPGREFPRDQALSLVPDMVVEILSPSSRRMDLRTKRTDYERFGVREYWVVEPDERRVRVFRLSGGVYAEAICEGATAASEAIPGFAFDLDALRAAMAV